jgi:hypothetical protein
MPPRGRHGKSGGIWASSAQKEFGSQKDFRSEYRVFRKKAAEGLEEGLAEDLSEGLAEASVKTEQKALQSLSRKIAVTNFIPLGAQPLAYISSSLHAFCC